MFHALFPSLIDRDVLLQNEQQQNQQHQEQDQDQQILHDKINYLRSLEYYQNTPNSSTSTSSHQQDDYDYDNNHHASVLLVQCEQQHLRLMIDFWERKIIDDLHKKYNKILQEEQEAREAEEERIRQEEQNLRNIRYGRQQNTNNNNQRQSNDVHFDNDYQLGSVAVFENQQTNNTSSSINPSFAGLNNNNTIQHQNQNNNTPFNPELYFRRRVSLGFQFILSSNRFNSKGRGSGIVFAKSCFPIVGSNNKDENGQLIEDDTSAAVFHFQQGRWNDFAKFTNVNARNNLRDQILKDREERIRNNNNDDDADDADARLLDNLVGGSEHEILFKYQHQVKKMNLMLGGLDFACTDHIPRHFTIRAPNNNNNNNQQQNKFVTLADLLSGISDRFGNDSVPVPELSASILQRDEKESPYKSIGDVCRRVLELASNPPPPPPSVEDIIPPQNEYELEQLETALYDNDVDMLRQFSKNYRLRRQQQEEENGQQQQQGQDDAGGSARTSQSYQQSENNNNTQDGSQQQSENQEDLSFLNNNVYEDLQRIKPSHRYICSIAVDTAGLEGSNDKFQILHLINCLNVFAESRRRCKMWGFQGTHEENEEEDDELVEDTTNNNEEEEENQNQQNNPSYNDNNNNMMMMNDGAAATATNSSSANPSRSSFSMMNNNSNNSLSTNTNNNRNVPHQNEVTNKNKTKKITIIPRFHKVQCLLYVGTNVINLSTVPDFYYNNNEGAAQFNTNNLSMSQAGGGQPGTLMQPTFLDGLVSGVMWMKSEKEAFYSNLSCLSFSPSLEMISPAAAAAAQQQQQGSNNNEDNENDNEDYDDDEELPQMTPPNRNNTNQQQEKSTIPSILGVNLRFSEIPTKDRLLKVEAY